MKNYFIINLKKEKKNACQYLQWHPLDSLDTNRGPFLYRLQVKEVLFQKAKYLDASQEAKQICNEKFQADVLII